MTTALLPLALMTRPALNGEFLVSQDLGPEAYRQSGFHSTFPKEGAFDGDPESSCSYWNAGDYAPQWIEVDLQRVYLVSTVKLVAAMLPDGNTTHEIWASKHPMREDLSGARKIGGFSGRTVDRDVISGRLQRPVSARYVQVRTLASPSWVAWMEVQVFAAPSW